MKNMRTMMQRIAVFLLTAAMVCTGMPQIVSADPEPPWDPPYNYTYTANAKLMDKPGDALAGVYEVPAVKGAKKDTATLGIPSIAKQNLESAPTTESPAIIQGAAVPFERRVNSSSTIRFDRINDEPIYAPYTYFRYSLVEENDVNGTGTHTKITGYDGTFVIVRVDVSELIDQAPAHSYLHYQQTDNKAMLNAFGRTKVEDGEQLISVKFQDGLGGESGCFSLDDVQASLCDKDGKHTETPYIDLILVSSGTIVAGADKGKEGAPPADFPIYFYVDQENDYNPDIDWDETNKQVINVNTKEPVQAIQDPDDPQKVIQPETQLMAKYYNEKVAKERAEAKGEPLSDADFTSYIVKGDDLELEVAVDEINEDDSTKVEYWSLRRAMDYQPYDNHTISLMCEVPMLEGLLLEDTTGGNDRKVELDVNSFDIQIANHTETNAAGLTVRNGASLTIKDDSNTTGAELAVGNNATMLIEGAGSKLIIDETCQMEVEYDSSSIAQAQEGQQQEEMPDLSTGVFTVRDGGEVINNGVITVEGAEGKAQDPADAQTVIRDYKDAVLTIGEGGTITNNGCMLVNGILYNLGTLNNNGRYNDVITSDDPDKGLFTYHRGIQFSWKDDITQGHTSYGTLVNGEDESGTRVADATVNNAGDIVLVPGYVQNHAKLDNSGTVYMSGVDRIIIPVTATQDAPTVTEDTVYLGYYESSLFRNYDGATVTNSGEIRTADFELVSNGRTGKILTEVSDDLDDLMIDNLNGTIVNESKNGKDGVIAVSTIWNNGTLVNKDNAALGGVFAVPGETGEVETTVILQAPSDPTDPPSVFTDSSTKKAPSVFNGAKTSANGTDTWTYTGLSSLTVDPAEWSVPSGETVEWTLLATPETAGEGIRYLINVVKDTPGETVDAVALSAGEALKIVSPAAPPETGNQIYRFVAEGAGGVEARSILRVNSEESNLGITKPTAMRDLVYNGMEQTLLTVGSSTDGVMQYRVNGGKWGFERPVARNAGTYQVSWRVVYSRTSNTVLDPGETIEVTIAKRPLYIAADDQTSKIVKEEDVELTAAQQTATLTYTAYGLADADKAALNITPVVENLDKTKSGTYKIKLTWDESRSAVFDNYEIEDENENSRFSDGVYYVSTGDFSLDLPDITNPDGSPTPQTPGVKSNFSGYENQLESILLTAKYPKDASVVLDKTKWTLAEVYYSDSIPLDAENYKTAGTLTAPSYAAVGTDKTVYYYIVTPQDQMAGSQRIVIEKARQEAPFMYSEQHKDGLIVDVNPNYPGGRIFNLAAREMEYRRSDSDSYIRATSTVASLGSGTYYVRRIGNDHYFPSPDTEVSILPDQKIKVTFDPAGGNLAPGTEAEVTVAFGDHLARPADPSRDGAGFLGWKCEGKAYDFDAIVTRPVTLVADWDVAEHTVSFNSNGGPAVDAQQVKDGAKAQDPGKITKAGYTFEYWYKDSETQAYDFDTPVTADVTLNAKWKEFETGYTIAFDKNGATSGTMNPIQNVMTNAEQVLPANTFARKGGYEFAGWNTEKNGMGTPYDDGATVKNLTDTDGATVTLYAQWARVIRPFVDENEGGCISVTINAGNLVYNGREQKPNIILKDKDTNEDVTRYCKFVYSDNINAGVNTARVAISVNSTNAPYDDKVINKTFTIAKAPAPERIVEKKTYMCSDQTGKSIDVASKLPTDCGNTTYTITSGVEPGFYTDPPAISAEGVLTYTLNEIGENKNTAITVEAVMQNYGGTDPVCVYVLEIEKKQLNIYEKDGNNEELCPEKNLIVGAKTTFVAKYSDETIDNKRVAWTSSDPGVATVDQNGKIKAISAGQTVITAVSEKLRPAEGTCVVTVAEAVSSVTLNAKNLSMGTGESYEAIATVLPFTATQALTWTVSDEDMADLLIAPDTMSAKIIARKEGKCKVTVSAADGSGKKTVLALSIGKPVPDFAITAKGDSKVLAAGKSLGLNITWKGEKPKNTDVIWNIATPIATDASGIATLSPKGVLQGLSEGTVRVTAVSASNPKKWASAEFAVYVPVKNVSLNVTTGTVSTAENAHGLDLETFVTSKLSGQQATGVRLKTAPTVTYEVDPKYKNNLLVDASGLVKARKGTGAVKNIPVYATVTAYNGYTKTVACKVSITEKNALKGLKLSKSTLTVGVDSMVELSVTLNPLNPDGDTGVGEPAFVPEGIAEVVKKDGKLYVVGKAPGQTTVTFTTNQQIAGRNGEMKPCTASCKVTVNPSVTQIGFANKEIEKNARGEWVLNNLQAGKSFTIKPDFTLSGEGKAASTGLSYTSSDPSIATVTDKGVIKAVGPKYRDETSTVKITVTSTDLKVDGGAAPATDLYVTVCAPVSKVVLDQNKLTLTTLNAKFGKVSVAQILPEKASNTKILWKADNQNVYLTAVPADHTVGADDFAGADESWFTRRVITGNGEALGIMALKPGVTKLTGITTDGTAKKVTATVTIMGKVTGITVEQGTPVVGEPDMREVDLKAGKTLSLKPLLDIEGISATTTDPDQKKLYSTYKRYTDQSVTYLSGNNALATVDGKGKIKAAQGAAGQSVIIYLTTAQGGTGPAARVKVNIVN